MNRKGSERGEGVPQRPMACPGVTQVHTGHWITQPYLPYSVPTQAIWPEAIHEPATDTASHAILLHASCQRNRFSAAPNCGVLLPIQG